MGRYINEILGPTTATACNGRPYPVDNGDASSPSHGFRAEVLIVSTPCWAPEEAIEIEGDARRIREGLQDALAALDIIAQDLIASGELDPKWAEPDPSDEDAPEDEGGDEDETVVTIRVDGKLLWNATHSESGWTARCDALKLGASGGTYAELQSAIAELAIEFWYWQLREGEIGATFERLGWTVTGLDADASHESVCLDIPYDVQIVPKLPDLPAPENA